MKSTVIKSITLAAAFSSSVQAVAQFETIVRCENNTVLLEVDSNARQHIQLAIRGVEVLTRVNEAFPLYLKFGQYEAVISGNVGEIRQTSPTESYIFSIDSVTRPQDFRKFQDHRTGALLQIERLSNGDLALQRFLNDFGISCDGYRDSEGRCSLGERTHSNFRFLGDYIFKDCHNAS